MTHSFPPPRWGRETLRKGEDITLGSASTYKNVGDGQLSPNRLMSLLSVLAGWPLVAPPARWLREHTGWWRGHIALGNDWQVPMDVTRNPTVIGSGIGGLAGGIALRRAGGAAEVFECGDEWHERVESMQDVGSAPLAAELPSVRQQPAVNRPVRKHHAPCDQPH
jgi:hypothetical protein